MIIGYISCYLVFIYLSEYNKPIALFWKKNMYALTSALMITLIMSPMVPCPLNNPAIMFKIAPIITITIRMTSNFTMPTLMMSLIASLMFNAYPRLSVSANLHAPMNKANPKIINRITPTINPRVSLIAPKMAIMIIGMIRYTIAMIMYLQPLIICLGISIEGASSLLSILNFIISKPYPSTRRAISNSNDSNNSYSCN